MAKKLLRIHELAKELGMTNQETLDLCAKLSIGVKGLSSTIIEQQADRVRARAERDGLIREQQPEEAKPVKKAAKKAAKKTETEGDEPKPVKKAAAKRAPAKKAAKKSTDDECRPKHPLLKSHRLSNQLQSPHQKLQHLH
ncbi:MAG: translation initiation factor, partial [Actinomycetota bacterium]